ncbi:hypothetical protein OE88DRAFT_1622255 [Heliocybe sulcata]|uniref:Uncharacterized protein n=1 Tax=Heliocybe sulcata TaxID=5364 RepID=A0A5C3NIK0_9AGAM|nr:hypothetical protein OE88DRAFT_1622255 [Heliocybe sulcata]
MVHILSECQSPGQEVIWQLTKTLWQKCNLFWFQTTIGLILASPSAVFLTTDGYKKLGNDRLFRILMTKSAQLI